MKTEVKKYIQPETIVAEVAMTAALLTGSAPDYSFGIGNGGDPADGR